MKDLLEVHKMFKDNNIESKMHDGLLLIQVTKIEFEQIKTTYKLPDIFHYYTGSFYDYDKKEFYDYYSVNKNN